MRLELPQRDIAQGTDFGIEPGQDAGSLFALGASFRVFGASQGAFGARVTNHDLHAGCNRFGLVGNRPAI